jgi:hypothetical protein
VVAEPAMVCPAPAPDMPALDEGLPAPPVLEPACAATVPACPSELGESVPEQPKPEATASKPAKNETEERSEHDEWRGMGAFSTLGPVKSRALWE